MALAYRQARRYGGRVWWVVLVAAWLLRRLDSRQARVKRYRVASGGELDVRMTNQGDR